MWLFTKYGMITAVCARVSDEPHAPADPSRMAIRTRTRQQLDNLIQRFSDTLSNVPVHEDPKADYRYRIFIPKAVWVGIAAELADEIDYDRFKPSVIPFPGDEE